jgi:hypothetical protein
MWSSMRAGFEVVVQDHGDLGVHDGGAGEAAYCVFRRFHAILIL